MILSLMVSHLCETLSVTRVYLCFPIPSDTVKDIIGDGADYSVSGSPLMFGASASSTNCVEDEELCFSFTAVQDSIKEEEEKFKLYLSTSDSGIRLCGDQGHISIPEDPADGMT